MSDDDLFSGFSKELQVLFINSFAEYISSNRKKLTFDDSEKLKKELLKASNNLKFEGLSSVSGSSKGGKTPKPGKLSPEEFLAAVKDETIEPMCSHVPTRSAAGKRLVCCNSKIQNSDEKDYNLWRCKLHSPSEDGTQKGMTIDEYIDGQKKVKTKETRAEVSKSKRDLPIIDAQAKNHLSGKTKGTPNRLVVIGKEIDAGTGKRLRNLDEDHRVFCLTMKDAGVVDEDGNFLGLLRQRPDTILTTMGVDKEYKKNLLTIEEKYEEDDEDYEKEREDVIKGITKCKVITYPSSSKGKKKDSKGSKKEDVEESEDEEKPAPKGGKKKDAEDEEEEEKPAPKGGKKKNQEESEDEEKPTSKSSKKKDVEDEEKPALKGGKKKDVEDEDAPKGNKKKNQEESEEEDEKPAPKGGKKKNQEESEDEEEKKPASKGGKKEESVDEEDAPKKSKKLMVVKRREPQSESEEE